MPKIKCAIYVRKSTERGLDMEFNSLHNQEEACRNYILSQAFQGWEFARVYSDGGISGGTMERPGLKQMLDDMARGLINVVVVYKVDRLSRSIMDFHKMMQEFEKHDCSMVSITQAFDTSTSMGKLTLNMLLSFAQFEREVSSERVRDKIRASRAKGIWTGGIPWLGYDIINKKQIVNPTEAAQVREIFESYLRFNSLIETARHLRTIGIFCKKWTAANGKVKGGNPISTTTLQRILREKLYIGYIEHKRTKTFARGEHDAIISEDLFNTVAERMAQNASGKSGRSNASPNLLSGKLYTTDGVRFINSVTKKKDGTPSLHYYGAQKNYINTNDIDPVVQNVIRDFLNSDLSALSPDVTHTLKQINFDTLDYVSRRTLIRYLIDRAIVSDTNITFFIKPDPNTIACYTTDEFINQNAAPMNFIQTGDTIIIKRDIVFTKGNQLTKYNTGRRGLMTLTENNHLIVRAFATAWRYRELYEKCGDSDAVIATEKTSWRNLYKYLTLSYLSPKIVNALMSGTLNMPLRDIYELSTKSQDFTEQERLFYNTLKSVT